ncbi:hypothetical protein WME98_32985 [Sorangium sp. So ce296]|uniref:hypothetical protein n=1 Tax=Sorangium sp. So ce296 TaxID=3133296 RepID=UPI003F62318F
MKDPVIALDAIPSILASMIVTNARPGARTVVRRRVATSAAIGAPAQARSSLRRSPQVAPRRVGADVERWTATRCPSAALAAL